MITPLLALAPATISWSPKVALVMIVANIIAIAAPHNLTCQYSPHGR